MNAIKGSVVSIVSSLFIAIVFAYTFRIPIPMGEMLGPLGEFNSYSVSPLDVLKMVFFAWVFYGMLSGFIVLALVGAVTGTAIGRIYEHSIKKDKMILIWGILITTILVFMLSILDFIIGPW